MAKIYFDAATKGNPGRSACAIIIKENSQRYTFTHDGFHESKIKKRINLLNKHYTNLHHNNLKC